MYFDTSNDKVTSTTVTTLDEHVSTRRKNTQMTDTEPETTPKMSEKKAMLYLTGVASVFFVMSTISIWAIHRYAPGSKPGDAGGDWSGSLIVATAMTTSFWAINAWQLHKQYKNFEKPKNLT